MASAETAEANETAGPSRPPARPSSKPSRHHLEPNPFEQSFSSKPSNEGSNSPDGSKSSKGEKKTKSKPKKTKANVKKENADSEGQNSSSKASDGDSRTTTGPLTPSATQTPSKRILPPVSSITSPAPHEVSSMQYPWSSSLTGSLRSGPLSPAMLAGPQSTFDVSSFRSGFTPDLSNFKTGLTPLGASTSFPPPSPNTAAFLAMVTNSSGATITPNTLSALSGNPMDSHANGSGLVSSQAGNNGDMKAQIHHHGEHHDQFDFAFGRSMQETPSKGGHHPSSKLRMSTGGEDRSASPDAMGANGVQQQNQHQQQGSKGQGGGTNQQQTTQAASGLFLLSQAHQELAKREDAAAAAAAAAAAHNTQSNLDGQQLYDAPRNANGNKVGKAGGNNKRKKSSEPAPAPIKGTTGKKTKTSKMEEMAMMEEEGYESDELDEDGNRRQKSSNGDGGDDEEKRKNFLERNRQAALKCRQRKKAWLASLQQKVEYLQSDNENLQGTVGALRNEVMYLKSQLMQAQRQLGGHGVEGGGVVGPGQSPTMGRNTLGGGSGPMQGAGNGMPMSHNMPPQTQQHQQNNINAMAAAAAAAAANNDNGNSRAGGTSGPYQAHAVPRPTHIPGQANNSQQYVSPNVQKNHVRQSSAQAA